MKKIKLNNIDILSHEMRTPLSIILGSVENIEAYYRLGKLDAIDLPAALSVIKNNCNRLARLTNNILDASALSRIDFVQRELVDAALLAVTIAETIGPLAFGKEIEINVKQPAQPIYMNVNIELFERLIMNLISNAIKYSGKKSKITISFKKTKSYASMSVSDNGIGIPADKTEKIFEPYVKLGNSGIAYSNGAGLGLAIVKTIAQLHEGTVSCKSNAKGSTFTVTIPDGEQQSGYTLKAADTVFVDKEIIYTELADILIMQ